MNDIEYKVLRDSMETYVNFANATNMGQLQKQFFIGAASAINDFCCRIGIGEKVADLAKRIPENG